jgi:hypothetical protein
MLSAAQREEVRTIAAEMAAIVRSGQVLAGSITERRTRCGHAGCRCMADPPERHGPYYLWTKKVRAKTVGRWLSPAQRDDYQLWIDNHRRIKQLMARVEAIAEEVFVADPRWRR